MSYPALILIGSAILFSGPAVAATEGFDKGHGFTQSVGGRGGRIVRVTSLERTGPGSLGEALGMAEPRIIVFEIAGVIDLDGKNLVIKEPLVTIAGQTAPSPGITLIRGGLLIATHDVIVQHLRVRPGEAGRGKKSGWEVDGIATVGGAADVIIDHCSCTWATDENLSASGPRFDGASVAQWREHTSHNITFVNCIVAEGLSQSTHGKGEHSKGSLIHDNASNIAIVGNLYASNVERNPLFKAGARGAIVNNLIVNPGRRAIHFSLVPKEWGSRAWVAGAMAVAGNLLLAGQDTPRNIALVGFSRGPLELYLNDNRALSREGKPLPIHQPLPAGDLSNSCRLVRSAPLWPKNLKPLAVDQVRETILAHAGARPWDRDAIDQRIIGQVRAGTSRIIDSERQVGGYPHLKPVRVPFNADEWDLDTLERKGSASGR